MGCGQIKLTGTYSSQNKDSACQRKKNSSHAVRCRSQLSSKKLS